MGLTARRNRNSASRRPAKTWPLASRIPIPTRASALLVSTETTARLVLCLLVFVCLFVFLTSLFLPSFLPFSSSLTVVDSCYSDPCLNGGSCNSGTSDSFSCLCTAQWTGSTCDEEVSPCNSSPCENGGSCTATSLTAYTCACTSGYTGTTCQTRKRSDTFFLFFLFFFLSYLNLFLWVSHSAQSLHLAALSK